MMGAGSKGSKREAYCLYVERPRSGGNEADGPFSAAA
jgi:hypothetical protein